ncbi:hypothetical protein [Isoptericola sp. NPDC055881]
MNTGRLLTRSPSFGEVMDTSIAKNAPSEADVALPEVLELADAFVLADAAAFTSPDAPDDASAVAAA